MVTEQEQEVDIWFGQTIALIKMLHDGEIYEFENGRRIAMSEDFQIGFVLTKNGVDCGISTLSELTFADLYQMRKRDGRIMIPNMRRPGRDRRED
jgi:hypothetical protein